MTEGRGASRGCRTSVGEIRPRGAHRGGSMFASVHWVPLVHLNSSHGHVCRKECLQWDLLVRTPWKFMPYLLDSVVLVSPLFSIL